MLSSSLTPQECLIVAIAGAFGSLVKDLVVDGAVQLPELRGKKLYLGFIAGAVIGSFVGMAVDGSFVTALMAGYTGTSVVAKLVGPTRREEIKREDDLEKK